jgi:Ner family transcriptional regulator
MKKDWHPADIISGLRKKGTSMAAISREAGLAPSTLANVLKRPWPKGEFLLAEALGVHPSKIWPSRYFDAKGKKIDRSVRVRQKFLPGKDKPAVPKFVDNISQTGKSESLR